MCYFNKRPYKRQTCLVFKEFKMPHKEYLRDAKGRFISAKNKHKEEEEVFPTDEKNSQLSLSFE